MSILNDIHFCDNTKCGRSIPRGEFRLKGLCESCWTGKRKRWQIFVVASILFLSATGFGSIWGLMDRDTIQVQEINRVEKESIARDAQIITLLQEQVSEIERWANIVSTNLKYLKGVTDAHNEEIASIKGSLLVIKESLLSTTDSTKKAAGLLKSELDSIDTRIKNLALQIKSLERLDIQTIERSILNPTVKVMIREKNSKHADMSIGTAVIFKREPILGGGFRYWAATDYHLFEDALNYLENYKDKEPVEKQLTPIFMIAHYSGLESTRPDYFVPIELLHPTKYIKGYSSLGDFAVFTFVCHKEWDYVELATDEEIKTLTVGYTIFNSSIFPSDRPAFVTGVISALNSSVYDGTLVVQASSNPGSSGSPVLAVFNGVPKVIGLIQVMSVSRVGGNSVLAYCSRLDKIRRKLKLEAPEQVKVVMGIK